MHMQALGERYRERQCVCVYVTDLRAIDGPFSKYNECSSAKKVDTVEKEPLNPTDAYTQTHSNKNRIRFRNCQVNTKRILSEN